MSLFALLSKVFYHMQCASHALPRKKALIFYYKVGILGSFAALLLLLLSPVTSCRGIHLLHSINRSYTANVRGKKKRITIFPMNEARRNTDIQIKGGEKVEPSNRILLLQIAKRLIYFLNNSFCLQINISSKGKKRKKNCASRALAFIPRSGKLRYR